MDAPAFAGAAARPRRLVVLTIAAEAAVVEAPPPQPTLKIAPNCLATTCIMRPLFVSRSVSIVSFLVFYFFSRNY